LVEGKSGPLLCDKCMLFDKSNGSMPSPTTASKNTDVEVLKKLRAEALSQQEALHDCLTIFDVESAAALRRQVEKEAEQLLVLLSWRSLSKATRASKLIKADEADKLTQATDSDRRLHILQNQISVLNEYIEAGGGWRAAIVVGPGYVNVEANLEYWHLEEREGMLKEMVKFLKGTLDKEHENKLSLVGGNDKKLKQLKDEIAKQKKIIEDLEANGGVTSRLYA
jgi:hypothetical protein